ncbi:MAG: bifunctional adenosylcobinamide kinase/adenosylcobinamide-phosphate guanylyltransferase [Roseburia sp.]|nr:bifunctional adenosylcobinamide kinase/adenosylcobinamide-phosphate guanylyltransferase [Roseburia sp.]MCM1241790.1 bifunctional adenosylcobinamide kinase/adenosylcobinamide-phosphate guanylyltransferase [Roseburia sp.]
MRLVIGGYAQGKLDYVLTKYRLTKEAVWDGILPEPKEASYMIVVDHLHQWVKTRILDGGCPEEEIEAFLAHCENCILISDEIGNGIVPIDAGERMYRERMGRLLIQLAAQAQSVERVMCGIGQVIK